MTLLLHAVCSYLKASVQSLKESLGACVGSKYKQGKSRDKKYESKRCMVIGRQQPYVE